MEFEQAVRLVLTILFMLVMFVLVLVLAYYATRFTGMRFGAGGMGAKPASRIKILDRMAIGQDKQLMIVEVAGRILLLGATSHSIQKLCELDPDELPPLEPVMGGGDFMEILKSALHKGKKGGEPDDKEH